MSFNMHESPQQPYVPTSTQTLGGAPQPTVATGPAEQAYRQVSANGGAAQPTQTPGLPLAQGAFK